MKTTNSGKQNASTELQDDELETHSSADEDWDGLHDTLMTVLNDKCSCIRNSLYIGTFLCEQNRKDLDQNRITHILQVGENMTQSYMGDFVYKTLVLADTERTNILVIFRECIEFIEDSMKSGGSVLVHCYAGISRSATICIAYLMWKENLTLGPAYSVVQCARNVAQPNDGFKRQLRTFENLGADLDLLDDYIKERTISRRRRKEMQTDEVNYC